ncbi:serine-rich adhesin for platelets-like [Haliotis rubra]|uniref:serine-rich adhesin for platelets-like n=1 Tax=Haliotis rubra TaxID=36100 RepID=UPI001EE54684|nr:serine-rich adhesin for platelets-like [Haliotis rubra]
MAKLTCLLGLMVPVMIDTVLGTGKIAVKVTRFLNPSGRDKNNVCCDGLNLPTGCPTGNCDNSFLLCGSSAASIASITDCDYGIHQFDGQKDQNSNNFSDDESLFPFDTWKGSVNLGINVTDLDTDGVMIIDNFSVNFTSTVFPSYNTAAYRTLDLTGDRPINPTSLRVLMTAYCDRYYFREDCSKRCVPQDNCDGHYGCDSSGNIVCRQGWTGAQCRQSVAGSITDCDVYDGLAKTSWAGNVMCNSTQAITLNIASQDNNGGVSGSLKTQGEVMLIGGSFNTTTKKLMLNVNKDNTSNVDIQVLATRENDTRLSGTVYRENETCKMELLQSTGSFDACGQGTCIRYGRKLDNFYCCCDDGKAVASCKASATTTLTTPSTEMTSPTTRSTVSAANTSLPIPSSSIATSTDTTTSISNDTDTTTSISNDTEATTSISTNASTPVSSPSPSPSPSTTTDTTTSTTNPTTSAMSSLITHAGN